MEKRNCKICGKEFIAKIHNQVCCSYECKALNKKLTTQQWNERQREIRKNNPVEKKPKQKAKPSNKVNLKKFPKHLLFDKEIDMEREQRINNDLKDTAQFNREARALGLTYGQYEAKRNFERQQKLSIEYMLKNKRKEERP